jgi:hypothetical protein
MFADPKDGQVSGCDTTAVPEREMVTVPGVEMTFEPSLSEQV